MRRRIDIDHRQVPAVLRIIVGIIATPAIAAIACAIVYFLVDAIIWGIMAVLFGLSAKVVARGYFSFRSRLSWLGYLGTETRLAVIVRLPLLQYLTLDLVVLLLRLSRIRAGATMNGRTRWMFHRIL